MILKILIGFALGYIAACVTFYILQKRERRRRKEKKKKVSLNTYAKVATMVTTQPTTEHVGIMWYMETKPDSVHLHIYRKPKAM